MKLTMIGDSSVGKTSLALQFTQDFFPHDHKPTITDIETRVLNIEGQDVLFQIWDTAGQEKFRSLLPLYLRGVDGALLVYDVTRQFEEELAFVIHLFKEYDPQNIRQLCQGWFKYMSNMHNTTHVLFLVDRQNEFDIRHGYHQTKDSFKNIPTWISEVRKGASGNPVMALVGNKTDLKDYKCVTTQDGEQLASEQGMIFMETSAKTGVNVHQAFFEVGKEVLKRMKNGPGPTDFADHVKVEDKDRNRKQRGCCS